MKREGENRVKDNSQTLGVFVQGDRRVVDLDGLVPNELAGPGNKESYR